MTTPRNSMSGAFSANPVKGPMAMKPVQRTNPRKVSSMVGPTQSFFMRESKALGAAQIMNGLFHIALGGLMMALMEVYAPICVILWYPLWGGILYIISGSLLAAAETNPRKSLVTGKMIINSLSLFAAIAGTILLIMDIFNITSSHFLRTESQKLVKTSSQIDIHNCELANVPEEKVPYRQYCYNIRSVFLSLFAVMLIFALFQKFMTAGAIENEWKKLCSKSKDDVVLLSAEEKKEEAIETKEVVELTEISVQPKNEEDIEVIPVQEEEEEETEVNFPEPPQDQESSPIENDCAP